MVKRKVSSYGTSTCLQFIAFLFSSYYLYVFKKHGGVARGVSARRARRGVGWRGALSAPSTVAVRRRRPLSHRRRISCAVRVRSSLLHFITQLGPTFLRGKGQSNGTRNSLSSMLLAPADTLRRCCNTCCAVQNVRVSSAEGRSAPQVAMPS